MKKSAKRGLFAMIIVALAIWMCPGSARAATRTIWPDQFEIAVDGFEGVQTEQDPDRLFGNGFYYAPVKLPIGSKVKFLRMNYRRDAVEPDGPFGWCVYLRRKSPSGTFENLIEFNRPQPPDSYPEGEGSVISQPAHVQGPLTVKRGYRYYIQYEPSAKGSLNSIQIVY